MTKKDNAVEIVETAKKLHEMVAQSDGTVLMVMVDDTRAHVLVSKPEYVVALTGSMTRTGHTGLAGEECAGLRDGVTITTYDWCSEPSNEAEEAGRAEALTGG